MNPASASRFRHTDLHEFTRRVLQFHRIPPPDALVAADALLNADLMGIDSHGIAHLPWHGGYVPGLRSGAVNPTPRYRVVRETPATALVDADGGMGVVVAGFAMERAIAKAAEVGVGMAAVYNSRHFGAAGHWALMAVPHRMAGIATCNGSPLVAPAGGQERIFNTNPIAFAAPAGRDHPFMYDAATSTVAGGKLELAAYAGKRIPLGWAKAPGYQDTDDPHILSQGGLLLPLGSTEVGGWHKGHGLAMVVDILSGLLSGNGHSALMAPGGSRRGTAGHFHAALRIDAFRDPDEWDRDMEALYRDVRAVKPVEGVAPVLVSGEREHYIRQERMVAGIPQPPTVVDQLREVGAEAGVPVPSGRS